MVNKNWKIAVVYHIEAIDKIVKFANDAKINILPISGAWLCLNYKGLFDKAGFDLFAEFIVDSDDFTLLSAKLILDDDYLLRSEAKDFNRFSIKFGKELFYFTIYKNNRMNLDYTSDLPTKMIWNRATIVDNVMTPLYEDGIMSLLWRMFHLLYRRSAVVNPNVFRDLIKKTNGKKLAKLSSDYNLKRFTEFIIVSFNNKKQISDALFFKILSYLKSEYLRKIYIKIIYSDFPFRCGIHIILKQIAKIYDKKMSVFKSYIANKFAKSYIVRKEIGNKENDFRLLNRLGARWNVENEITGEFLVSTSSGLWYLKDDFITMILPGSCFGISGGPEKWFICQYTGNYSRILEFTLTKQNDQILLLERNNYLVGLPSDIHQIDIYDNHLYIINATDNSLIISPSERKYKEYYPNRRIKKGSSLSNHFNSIFIKNDNIYLMAHNGTSKDARDSEIYLLNRHTLKTESVIPINAQKAHNIFFLNKKLGYCNSPAGELILDENVIFKNENYFLRGVALNSNSIVIGGSEFATRENREKTSSMIFELNHQGELMHELFLKNIGQIHDIRYIGKDLGMSAFGE